MDTKIQALEKAQKVQRRNVNNWCSINNYDNPTRFEVIKGGNVIGVFEYSEPKPLERDTLCLVFLESSRSLFLYSTGRSNEWYPPGSNSRNYTGWLGKMIICDNFEIIETPGEFERVQPGIEMCLSNRCIYFDPRMAKCTAENPNECTVLIGKPSKLNTAKNCKP